MFSPLITVSILLLVVIATPARAEEAWGARGCDSIVLEGLGAWSAFLASGDVADLSEAFVRGGPQWQQLLDEVGRGRVDPPVTFEVVETVLRSRVGQSVTVWAEVVARQEDHHSDAFGWDFDMVDTPDGCRVWTVLAAERPMASEARPVDTNAIPLTTTSPTTPALTAATSLQAVEAEQPPVVRLPAVVAWVIVITLAGVAAAGYLAPRLDRRDS